jgi:nicotinate-nucleotide adenylyltransferase
MPKPSYTIDTLTYLSEKHPDHEIILLMGSDGLPGFHKWKNSELIAARYTRFVYPRHGTENYLPGDQENISMISGAPLIGISSSFIRKAIKEKKVIDRFLPKPVFEFIDKYGLYR